MTRHIHHDLRVYGDIKLYAGSGSPELAQIIADYLGQPLSEQEVIRFPNENLFVKLKGSARGQDVYIIQSKSSPVHHNLMELLISIQTLRLDSAARITAVVPYLCYGRSDKKDQPRVPITARLIADMIEVAGADRYMTLDPHAGQIQGFFAIPGDVLTASLAQSGNAQAQLQLGDLYYHGHGVKESDEEALRWYERAANQGVADAQFLTANMYAYGLGVPRSDAEVDRKAAKWYFEAPRQGHRDAQYSLAIMFLAGKGVERDEPEASKWMKRAADQGHEDARRYFGK